MHVLDTCKNEEDSFKNEVDIEATRFLPLKVYGDFSRCPSAAHSTVLDPIWPNSELGQDFMVVLVTCKNQEDPTKNEG